MKAIDENLFERIRDEIHYAIERIPKRNQQLARSLSFSVALDEDYVSAEIVCNTTLAKGQPVFTIDRREIKWILRQSELAVIQLAWYAIENLPKSSYGLFDFDRSSEIWEEIHAEHNSSTPPPWVT